VEIFLAIVEAKDNVIVGAELCGSIIARIVYIHTFATV
jgi:hypothetical protein